MAEITYQMVLSTLQTAGILVGIAYYVMNLHYTRRNQEETLKTRRTMIFHQLCGYFLSNPEAVKHIRVLERNPISSYEEHRELMSNNPEYFNAYVTYMINYELLGIYLKAGVVDKDMHAQFQPSWSFGIWERYKDIIYEDRKTRGPSWWRNVEYLMDSMQEYFKQHPELAI